ncbi:S41 family peptidase [Segetibacter sp.]|uniref:S41 family peptidase n=1 Tax=Segetibacter sp. TaxID=2231182 RepID=UPI00261148AC|nr:S41 family peptidase [Segetibacter sp.]MCW3078927.1 peptidase [Segetibacter sp.]
MHKSIISVVCLLAVASSSFSQQHLLLRHPAINKDGSVIAFSYQGDIWTVPATGGRPSRITVHEAYESNPVFSPDGKSIAFSGARYGNADIFTIPVDGGTPRRLTFHSAADNIASWQKPDRIMFTTVRDFRQIEGVPEVYAVQPTGGTEQRVMDVLGFEPVTSANGQFVAFVRGQSNPVFREDYRGTANREIWIYDTKNKTYNKLPLFDTNDIMPRWSGNNTLYFLSSNSGTYNLYKIALDDNGKAASKPQQLTDSKDEAIRHFNISADGAALVYEKDMNLYLMKTARGNAEKINIQLSADDRYDPVEQKSLAAGASDFTLSPNGKLMAYTVRGEVFLKEADKEKNRSINISNHPFRDMSPEWLNDSTLLFTSDRKNGNFDIYMVRSVDTTEVNLFKTLKPRIIQLTETKEDETSPVVSNDGKRIAYVRGRGTLVVTDIATDGKMKNEKVLTQGWANPSGMAWSPDNKWLAYSMSDLYANFEVYIQAADNSARPINVTMHPRTDRRPFWSADGSKLGFISARNNLSADVWFVWLRKEDWEKVNEDWQDQDVLSTTETTAKAALKDGPKPLKIDFDGISERTVQVTNFPGDEGDFVISKDGQTFYYTATTSTAKGRDLYSIRWDGKELKELTKAGSNPFALGLDKEGKFIYFSKQGGAIARVDVKTNLQEALPYASKLKIDYTAEREQIYEEAWRTIRDDFYDPKMHGYDWNALHDKYRNRAVYASSANDFRDMFNYMLGELNSSHMGFVTSERGETQKETTGLLGAELLPVAQGMKVIRVIPDAPANRTSSRLFEGDIIYAINGDEVKAADNFYSHLNGMVNEKVLLSVRNAKGQNREVVIRPTATLADPLYHEWVVNRRKLVDKYSNGKLGYIHIQAMSLPSFESVEREFASAGFGKDGLVIDVRYNGGGSTTDYLMSVLNYKQHAYAIPRGATDNLERDKTKFRDYYPVGERLVYAAWLKPSIAVCNEGSYSNAEIFSHAYKQLGIGKLVGQSTNGSVISTGAKVLLDGSTVRTPMRGWFVKATDKNEELGPAIPDIIVENPLTYNTTGDDVQLKVATEELMKQVAAKNK